MRSVQLASAISKYFLMVLIFHVFQQHTVGNQESYPDDKALIGRLDVCRGLLGFVSNEQKVMIGSEPNGTRLIKVIL